MSLSHWSYPPAKRGGGAVICFVVQINTILRDPGVASPRDDAMIFSDESLVKFKRWRAPEDFFLPGQFPGVVKFRPADFFSPENIASSGLVASLDESTLATE